MSLELISEFIEFKYFNKFNFVRTKKDQSRLIFYEYGLNWFRSKFIVILSLNMTSRVSRVSYLSEYYDGVVISKNNRRR